MVNDLKPLSNYDKMVMCQKAYDLMFSDEDEPFEFRTHYLCAALDKFIPDSYKSLTLHEVLPELIEYKPEGKLYNGAWWSLDQAGMDTRKDILHELIMRFKLSED